MRSRPSDVYHIQDELAAYCFDRAITTFGLAVEADIDESVEGSKDESQARRKAQMTLNKWLRDPEEEQTASGDRKFKDPMDLINKRKGKE